jgi:tetratricopeptide (TPR) repeat protein
MTDVELARAAQQALSCISDENRLAATPLFAHCRNWAPEQLQALVYDAVAALGSESAPLSDKRRRHREILTRCDLQHQAHKAVIAALRISRREFYRERREALLRLGDEIARSIERPDVVGTLWGSIDQLHAAHALMEASRWSGQYEAAWRQTCALAPHYAGTGLEITLWVIAQEAASHLAWPKEAREALARARDARARYEGEHALCADLWLALGEIDHLWNVADYEGAQNAFERVASARCDERTSFDDSFAVLEARLYRSVLIYTASLKLDCGEWEKLRVFLARANAVSAKSADVQKHSLAIAGQSPARLQGELELRGAGNVQQAIAHFEEALRLERTCGLVGSAGLTAGSYASALAEAGMPKALEHAEFGLEIVGHYFPGDRLVKLTLQLLPILVRDKGIDAAAAALSRVRRTGLGLRDAMLLDLADAKMAFYAGAHARALERADGVAVRLASRGMHAWACDAQLLGVEASMRVESRQRAASRLSRLSELLGSATAQARARARDIGTSLNASSADAQTRLKAVG